MGTLHKNDITNIYRDNKLLNIQKAIDNEWIDNEKEYDSTKKRWFFKTKYIDEIKLLFIEELDDKNKSGNGKVESNVNSWLTPKNTLIILGTLTVIVGGFYLYDKLNDNVDISDNQKIGKNNLETPINDVDNKNGEVIIDGSDILINVLNDDVNISDNQKVGENNLETPINDVDNKSGEVIIDGGDILINNEVSLNTENLIFKENGNILDSDKGLIDDVNNDNQSIKEGVLDIGNNESTDNK